MPSLILTPRLTSDSVRLEKAARTLGWPVHRAVRYRLPPAVDDPVVHGEVVFCDVMARELGLGLLEPTDDWLPQLPLRYRGRNVELWEHGDLRRLDQRSFIKPANDKYFEAGIFEHGAHVPRRHIDPGAPVLVSDVVYFEFELRCYILDRKLLTAGVYAFTDAAPSAAKERALYESGCEWIVDLLEDPEVQLPSAVVIDVGLIQGVGWVVVEANQGYCSGIYAGGFSFEHASPGADPLQALRVVERSAGLRSKVRPEDQRWLRP